MGIKLGLVGLGSFGGAFAPLFKAHPLVDAIALCDAEPSKLKAWAERPDFQDKLNPKDVYDSLDAICRSDCDAIALITQPSLHAPQCIQIMNSGKHVYSAVPVISLPDFDETLAWCEKLIETVRKTGCRYMLGETTYYRPQTMFCRAKAASGEFGEYVYAEGEYVHDVDWSRCSLREVRKKRSTGNIGANLKNVLNAYRALHGITTREGLLSSPMSYPTHSISGPMSVMNTRALSVSAIGHVNHLNDPFFANSAFSDVTAFFRLANGASLRIAECREMQGNIGCDDEDFRIFGTRASYSNLSWRDNHRVVCDEQKKITERKDFSDIHEIRVEKLPDEVACAFQKILHPEKTPDAGDFVPAGHGGSHPYLVHEFIASVAEHRMPAINVWDAAHWMAMGAAAHKSALRDGEIVKVADFGRAPEA